ncbi:MAG: glycoside hydrolase family 92 protein [Bacteroidetes bacterium]|nr:glycoside hydrolase family 92 protein [Bacteroidota bacterium]
MNSCVKFALGVTVLFSVACSTPGDKSVADEKQPVDYVNPYMGNISHLLVPTFPTVHLPNSMLRLVPQRGDFTGRKIHGLPLILTTHRGSQAFNMSPFQGVGSELKPVVDYSYDQEKITPYSYAVYLDDQEIEVDYGLSHQSAAYELKFEKEAPVHLLLNSSNGEMNWDGTAISGYQELENDTRVYLYLLPEKSPQLVSALNEGVLTESNSTEGKDACLVLEYPQGTKALGIRYGVSFVDEAQAQKNLEREVDGKSVAQLQAAGRDIWNEALGKIKVAGGTEDDKYVFYTSFYRTYERQVSISEDGRYWSPFDKSVHEDLGRKFYIDDWIWDSYRAHHPLRILIDAEMEEDILHSFIVMTEQMEDPWMPTFPKITGDSRGMNSNHGVAVVLDAHRKGLGNFDLEKAYLASKAAITEKTLAPWSGVPAGVLDEFYVEHGYFPALREGQIETAPEVHIFERRQPVAVTLGTAYDQWCLSQIAEELGKTAEAEYFKKASFNYRNLFNGETAFFHPKDDRGDFIEPFDYVFGGGMGARAYYDENNGWVYRWDVQHNIPDLIDLMGGDEAFVNNLDAMFNEPLGRSKYAFFAQLPDHTGNVGQFSMANEPSLHIPYLYNYAGQPWKTQKCIRQLLKEWFRSDLMGVPGDEDGGGVTAFVVFSQMGFYPVTPGEPVYSIGSPIFDHVAVQLSNGNIFEVEANDASDENKYIQSATLNGESLDLPWISHEAVASGGKLVVEMGPRANKNWGVE